MDPHILLGCTQKQNNKIVALMVFDAYTEIKKLQKQNHLFHTEIKKLQKQNHLLHTDLQETRMLFVHEIQKFEQEIRSITKIIHDNKPNLSFIDDAILN